MAESVIKDTNIHQASATCTLNTNAGVTGGLTLRRYGNIVTISGTVKYASTGTSLNLAYLPNTSWYPQQDTWLACSVYGNYWGIEGQVRASDGHLVFSQYTSNCDIKVSGSWILAD